MKLTIEIPDEVYKRIVDYKDYDICALTYAIDNAINNGVECVEPKKGEWIEIPRFEGDKQPDFKCSNCGHIIDYFSEYNLCPDCGADMRGEEE